MKNSDVVISVLPSDISTEAVGKHLKVQLIQANGKAGFKPAFMLNEDANIKVTPASSQVKVGSTCGVTLASYKKEYYGRQASVVEMDGKLEDINDYKEIEKFLSGTAAKVPGELATELIKVGANSPGSLDGSGLFQTLTALKLREFYESVSGKTVKA
mmetsp:Transcript_2689/g.2817  ORF Transcript_2689/g.2817 Transcript_2689/m.2817 type:complete len:157 (+) Transcript_2689:103-573(+)